MGFGEPASGLSFVPWRCLVRRVGWGVHPHPSQGLCFYCPGLWLCGLRPAAAMKRVLSQKCLTVFAFLDQRISYMCVCVCVYFICII